MTNQERYVWCRDKFEDNEIILWNDFCNHLEIDMPIYNKGDLWTAHVQTRNQVKAQINLMARSRTANWRICVHERGETLIKQVSSTLVHNDIPTRAKRILQHMGAAVNEVNAFKEIDKLSASDKKYCSEMASTLIGCGAFLYGQIQQLKGLSSKDRQQLLSIVDMRPDIVKAS